jgi:hypothetical protein
MRRPAQDPRFYGWWGDMDFAPHLLKMLAAPRHGRVEVIFHPEVPVDAFRGPQGAGAHCERVIRTAHPLAGVKGASQGLRRRISCALEEPRHRPRRPGAV